MSISTVIYISIHTYYVGSIPEGICDLKSLAQLYLNNNELTGETLPYHRHAKYTVYSLPACVYMLH